MKLAFIGLGVMGFPMAGHLAQTHQVTVFNRSPDKAQRWVDKYGGKAASTPGEAAQDAAFVLSCVGNDDDVRHVTTGPDGAYAAMNQGAVFIDHTTTSAKLARELAQEAQERGLHFLDAPVSGGQSGAEAGKLSIMVGGETETFTQAGPVLNAYGKIIVHMGATGAGQLAKMVNQICIAGLIQGLAEGLAFSKAAGLDGERLLGVISQGAAGSWQMTNRGRTMLEGKFDFGFAIDWAMKDLAICLDEASRNGAKLPVTAEILEFYKELSAGGGGRLDTSSLICRL